MTTPSSSGDSTERVKVPMRVRVSALELSLSCIIFATQLYFNHSMKLKMSIVL